MIIRPYIENITEEGNSRQKRGISHLIVHYYRGRKKTYDFRVRISLKRCLTAFQPILRRSMPSWS